MLLMSMVVSAASASGAPCIAPDNISRVTGGKECLLIKTRRHEERAKASTLFVLLHGNHSNDCRATGQIACSP